MYNLTQATCRSMLLAHPLTELLVSHTALHRLLGARTRLLAFLLTGLVLGAGCADDNTAADPERGGHGELHADHCHCDPGFAVSDDESSCVPEPDGVSDQDHDAGNDHDHGSDAGHGDGDVELSFAPSETRAATGTADDGTQVWLLEAADGDAVLGLEIYEAFGGPTSPGIVDVTDAETSYQQLRAAVESGPLRARVDVRAAECLSICPRPCGIALSSGGAWTYLFGDQQPGETVDDVLECVSLYLDSTVGFMARERRPKSQRASILGRVPPQGGQACT